MLIHKIITDPNKKVKTNKDIIVGAGWKPGWSTDYDAVLIAKNHNVKTIINLTNIDYVYDKNPSEFPDAKPLKELIGKVLNELWAINGCPGFQCLLTREPQNWQQD